MARTLTPPAERFDPITARWLTPGGPLHDPERDSVDPDHVDPVALVGPVPRELSSAQASQVTDDENAAHRSRAARRRRLFVLVMFALIIVGMLIGGVRLG